MTHRFVVTLSDESTCAVDADRVDVVDGGALVFAVTDGDASAMREIFLLNARSWRWCVSADAGVSWSSAQWGGAQQDPAPPQRPPTIPLQAEDIPDPLRRSRW